MKWKMIMTIAAAVLLIGVNLFLIIKENSRIERSFFVQDWTQAKEQNLQKTLITGGVTAPLEEQQVYYDSNKGSFEDFMVEEGETVESGSPLFYYSTDSYQEAITILEAEQSSLERQLDGLRDKRINLGRLLTSESASLTEEYVSNPSVEIDLYETEAQIQRLESEIEEYDERIRLIDDKLPLLQAVSNIDGFVKDVNEDLSNPILTVASHEVIVEGEVTEAQQTELKPGMKVEISFANSHDIYRGIVDKVSVSPKEKPEVGEESMYVFTVVLDELVADIPHGSQAVVEVVTEEVKNAITVPAASVVKSHPTEYVFVLNNGKVEKREVESGLRVHHTLEIENGLEEGEFLSAKPLRFESGHPTFFTPMKVTKWEEDMYEGMGKLEMLKYVGKGFLSM